MLHYRNIRYKNKNNTKNDTFVTTGMLGGEMLPKECPESPGENTY